MTTSTSDVPQPPAQPTRRETPVYFNNDVADDILRLQQLYQRLTQDAELRARARRDGASVLRENGFFVPEDVEIIFHDYDPYEHHLVLPPPGVELIQLDVDERYRYRFQIEV
jgi:hypothetical protein